MKFPILILLVYSFWTCGCDNKNKRKADKYPIEAINSDSVKALSRAVKAFEQSFFSCKDSIVKYNLEAVNETLIRYLYTIFGARKLEDYPKLTVAVSNIKLTGFKKNPQEVFSFHYTLFIKDTIPINRDLIEGSMIHSFEFDNKRKKIIKAFLGQHSSFMDGETVEQLYKIATEQGGTN